MCLIYDIWLQKNVEVVILWKEVALWVTVGHKISLNTAKTTGKGALLLTKN